MLARFVITFTKKFGLIFILIGLIWTVVFIKKTDNEVKVDWNDYKQLSYDALTVGFGEHGESAKITEPELVKLNERLFDIFGLSVVVSDVISVNRSIPDYRFKECLDKRYFKHLPSISVIIIFNNEVFSVFKRTLHSLYNRTPHQLVKEVILVNDNSTFDYLYEPLQDYIREHFPKFTFKTINLRKRSGLVKARTIGAKAAASEFLFFMEPHMELGMNWLPPLLEPVYLEQKTVSVPIIDFIEYTELKIAPNYPSRGIFDWSLEYRQIPRLPHTAEEDTNPYNIPIMTGGIFLIRKSYFFELGPYDDFIIWGAENLEMSFKLNLCGGKLIEVPCSRMAHMYRLFNKFRKHEKTVDFVAYNKKRVAEVWMDDYKKYVYQRDPGLFNNIDPGDLSKPKALKDKLKCKPFKYFIESVAPDMLDMFPPQVYNFANGSLRVLNTNHCIDTFSRPIGSPVGIYQCNAEHPDTQYFELSWYRDIRLKQPDICLESPKLDIVGCHYNFGNQFFKYDVASHQIFNPKLSKCLDAELEVGTLKFSKCDRSSHTQKWEWSQLNMTALLSWEESGRKLES